MLREYKDRMVDVVLKEVQVCKFREGGGNGILGGGNSRERVLWYKVRVWLWVVFLVQANVDVWILFYRDWGDGSCDVYSREIIVEVSVQVEFLWKRVKTEVGRGMRQGGFWGQNWEGFVNLN